ncbi:hypothetical protein DFP72DRAFT_810885 [Ephemerocybe angulata]|uniref:YMC020W-like alpha/beta hydrolase domain-containing protein n=1 Tax=Ephemerocybe angulata TaxID=980116 RepID=A0A8H6I2E3_9AGAR|nr:hypothetical protein DFP72DRAFT_830424 [Tulosesus angulatus]KAF6756136.1 hypothetical protein DFP72DRAFT_810885 [Tulosesus angulatus]
MEGGASAGAASKEGEAEPANPIEESIKANRSGWASFFSKQSMLVKAIGYGESGAAGTIAPKEVKRDEHGAEVMDLDSDAEDSASEEGSRRDDASADGRSRSLVPKLLTLTEQARSSSTPPNTNGINKPIQPPVAEKSKSAPVTPKRASSPAPSISAKKSGPSALVLPTWADTFHAPPRSVVLRPPSPPAPARLFGKTMKFMSGVLFAKDGVGGGEHQQERLEGGRGGDGRDASAGPGRRDRHGLNAPHPFGQELPKSWEVIERALSGAQDDGDSRRPGLFVGAGPTVSAEGVSEVLEKDVLRGCKRVVVIGVHGWFPGAMMRTMLGEPTGTSSKFANMMEAALEEFEQEHGVNLEKVTKIPLEGEGTIERRVEKLYSSLVANSEWMDDLREADVVFVATHSQGSVVSTHLLNKLIQNGIVYTRAEEMVVSGGDTFPSSVGMPKPYARKVQRVCCLALCGIHLGPLRYLRSSSLVAPYIQYFESTAARELFEFQDTESAVSKAYVKALENVLDHGIKMVYVASLNDQVVPIYSGIFTAATHPLILRALYIDGDAYHSSDFLSNLLVLLLRLRNSGIPDGGLLTHLSEGTAGSLSGVGHSTAYEELATYSLAVRYLFLTNSGAEEYPKLVVDQFNAAHEQNDYEIPWSLRDVIADERVIHFFSNEVGKLRDAFREWHPKTTILRDLKRKLQPIQRLPTSFSMGPSYSTSKL